MSSPDHDATLILGVGNVLKGDDAVGPWIVERLHEATGEASSCRMHAVDCGTVPENYTSVVRRLQPGCVIIVDAADMGLEPGTIRIIPKARAGALGLSTHSMPLSLFIDYIEGFAHSIMLIGVQPGSMRLGAEMSPQVRKAVEQLVTIICEDRLAELPRLPDESLGDNEVC